MIIQISEKSASLAQKVLESHDGVAAKSAKIILCACKESTIEAVSKNTCWSVNTVRRVLDRYVQEGDLLFKERPTTKRPLIKNRLFTTYEGAEWKYYGKALFNSEHSAPMLVVEEIKRLLPNSDSSVKILEIGPGEGPISMMLRDAGYIIECVDVGDYEFIPTDIPLTIMDVDKGLFAALSAKQYDAIIAVEVVEHLRKPWSLIEDAFLLLKPGGHFLLTTPNIAHFVSRAYFLTDGVFYLFPKPIENNVLHGHITPIPWYFLEYMFKICGFEAITTKQTTPMSIICLWPIKALLRSIFRILAFICSLNRTTPYLGKSILISGRKHF